jgi:hypothetical protein
MDVAPVSWLKGARTRAVILYNFLVLLGYTFTHWWLNYVYICMHMTARCVITCVMHRTLVIYYLIRLILC